MCKGLAQGRATASNPQGKDLARLTSAPPKKLPRPKSVHPCLFTLRLTEARGRHRLIGVNQVNSKIQGVDQQICLILFKGSVPEKNREPPSADLSGWLLAPALAHDNSDGGLVGRLPGLNPTSSGLCFRKVLRALMPGAANQAREQVPPSVTNRTLAQQGWGSVTQLATLCPNP